MALPPVVVMLKAVYAARFASKTKEPNTCPPSESTGPCTDHRLGALEDTAISVPLTRVRLVTNVLHCALLHVDSPAKPTIVTAPPASVSGREKPMPRAIVVPGTTGTAEA